MISAFDTADSIALITQPGIKPEPGKMARAQIWLLTSIGFAACIAALLYFNHNWTSKRTDNIATKGGIPTRAGFHSSYIERDVTPINSGVSGIITDVLCSDNQAVEKGQPLIRLEPRGLDVRLKSMKVEFAKASGQVLQAEATHAQAREALRRAETQCSTSRAKVDEALWNLDRVEDLSRGQVEVITRHDLDSAQAAVAAARDAAEKAIASCNTAAASVKTAEANMAAAITVRDRVQKMVDDAAQQCSGTTLCAPASGRITTKNVQVGQNIQPGQTLMSVVSEEHVIRIQ